MQTYLKIKIMSLAAESRIIRREERRWPGPSFTRAGLREHRIRDVRRESRAAGLAYGYLRGRHYRQLEAKCRDDNHPDWDRVVSLVAKYGIQPDKRVVAQELTEWSQAA